MQGLVKRSQAVGQPVTRGARVRRQTGHKTRAVGQPVTDEGTPSN